MTPYLQDPDFTLHVGDVLDVLPLLAPGSVDCVITSPPYWGLRDYGTGQWAGGDPDCDHKRPRSRRDGAGRERPDLPNPPASWAERDSRVTQAFTECECGATRQDHQLGLEATPDLYVQNMVAVFRQVWRVLAPHGTCWVNLGDSYASGGGLGAQGASGQMADRGIVKARRPGNPDKNGGNSNRDGVPCPPGLKPKDLVGIPWRVAFALQADGWYLRSDIVWAKPNPMPESVTDRPTKSHEYVFLLTRQPRYWFDAEAVREPHKEPWRGVGTERSAVSDDQRGGGIARVRNGVWDADALGQRSYNPAGRNIRSVWEIATQPYPEAHFATYPEELVRRCLLAGCPEWVCRDCGEPRRRLVETTARGHSWNNHENDLGRGQRDDTGNDFKGSNFYANYQRRELGWSDCGCTSVAGSVDAADADARDAENPAPRSNYRPGVVLDPFLGSGTTALVARHHGRHCIGVELSPAYARLAARRLQQLSLLAEIPT